MVQKHPGQVELRGDVLGERLHADRLGRVMARKKDVPTELLGVEERPVLAFARDIRVEAGGGSLRNQRPTRSRDDADPASFGRTEGKYARSDPQLLREVAGEILTRDLPLPPHTDRGAVI